MRSSTNLLGSALLAVATCVAAPVMAQGQNIGSVTKQTLPRWVSMKAEEANARRGPSMNHRIDWVFQHRHMPLLVTAEYGHWRRVEDRDGVGGWVHYVLLSRSRTAIVDQSDLELRQQPFTASPAMARAEKGAIVHLKTCKEGWCRVSGNGQRGWVPESSLWGASDPGG
ncbi:MAG: SH3 domain-containing protein [Pseudomonadota bacterium]